MYNYTEVDAMISKWKAEWKTKAEIIVLAGRACIGWPYVFGALGQLDSPSLRRNRAAGSTTPESEATVIKKGCQVLNGKSAVCTGCKYFPNGQQTRAFDCRGFTRWLALQVGIGINGAGATSQWNDKENWAAKGTLDTMPRDKVCITFMYNKNTNKMEHTLVYSGEGTYIHCSGEVKEEAMDSVRKVTHWAIPKGLYDENDLPVAAASPATSWMPTLRRGSAGENVKVLQTKLLLLGYDLGSYGADGDFGGKTEAAVKAFQKTNGLVVDGVVGPMTWAALENGKAAAEEFYTVKVTHLTLEKAQELIRTYGGEMAKE